MEPSSAARMASGTRRAGAQSPPPITFPARADAGLGARDVAGVRGHGALEVERLEQRRPGRRAPPEPDYFGPELQQERREPRALEPGVARHEDAPPPPELAV